MRGMAFVIEDMVSLISFISEELVEQQEEAVDDDEEEKLFEACEGRTLRSHKPTGKLARLAEQDKQYSSDKTAKKEEENDNDEEKKEKKRKKHKKSKEKKLDD